jgi:hypothetical protein
MISSAGRFLSGVIGFLVLLKTLSHSADMDAATERLVLRCPTKIWGIEGLGEPQRRQQRPIHAEGLQAHLPAFGSKKAGKMERNS